MFPIEQKSLAILPLGINQIWGRSATHYRDIVRYIERAEQARTYTAPDSCKIISWAASKYLDSNLSTIALGPSRCENIADMISNSPSLNTHQLKWSLGWIGIDCMLSKKDDAIQQKKKKALVNRPEVVDIKKYRTNFTTADCSCPAFPISGGMNRCDMTMFAIIHCAKLECYFIAVTVEMRQRLCCFVHTLIYIQ